MKSIRRGATGASVRYAQELLNKHGFGPLVEDGAFGKGTHAAVEQFQQANALDPVDGWIGADTWAALTRKAPEHAPPVDATGDQRAALMQAAMDVAGAHPNGVSLVVTALVDLGAREIPDGSNSGPEIRHLVGGYNAYWRIGPTRTPPPWCAQAVTIWIGITLGLGRDMGNMRWKAHPFRRYFGGVLTQLLSWADKNGTLKPPAAVWAKPGAVFLMGRKGSGSDVAGSKGTRAGHTGVVVAQDGPNHFLTVEGNTSNSVASRRRRIDSVTGFVWWWETLEVA